MDYSGRDKTNISIDPKESMLEKYVQIVTSDGRIFVGTFFIFPKNTKIMEKIISRIFKRIRSSLKFDFRGV